MLFNQTTAKPFSKDFKYFPASQGQLCLLTKLLLLVLSLCYQRLCLTDPPAPVSVPQQTVKQVSLRHAEPLGTQLNVSNDCWIFFICVIDTNVFFRALRRLCTIKKGQNRATRWRNYSGHCTRYERLFPLVDFAVFLQIWVKTCHVTSSQRVFSHILFI